MTLEKLVLAPFNEILGTASSNVPAYSNTDDEMFSIERHYLHGVFMGIKWQCVEYARRWLLLRKGCVFKNIRCAADIWTQLTSVERVTDGEHIPLKAHPNGSPTPPQIDSFLIYPRSAEQPVGHIAVICEVGPNYIRIAEQNNKFHYWDGAYAREIPMIHKDGLYYLEDEDPVDGWMEIEDHHLLKPLDDLGIDAIHAQYKQTPPTGKFEYTTAPAKADETKVSWLNQDVPAEKYFLEHYSHDFERANHRAELLSYYKINFDFMMNVAGATNELHRMFLEATNHVLHNDELLARFGIPKAFWDRLRQSWTNEQDLTINGRFDLAFDGTQLKVYEYNADGASSLFECAVMQKKWAEALDLPSTFTTGRRLHGVLVGCWKRMKITTRVHLLIDESRDEMLTALYMQQAMKEAGIESKLCVGTDQLYWKDAAIIDSDGQPVKFVWKLCPWDAVFQDYLAGKQLAPGEHPRISDVLLHDQIQVIEPIWKAITGNKALLPVLWHMYPNHPYLLQSEWNLTDELKQKSTVKKSIAGRNSDSIVVYGSGGHSVLAETTGHLSTGDMIYQELFPLKNDSEHHPVIGSWIIRRNFGGFVVRDDRNLITTSNSPVTPCCIVWEEEK